VNFLKEFLIDKFGYIILLIAIVVIVFFVDKYKRSFEEYRYQRGRELINQEIKYLQLSSKAANLERKYVDQKRLLKKVEEEWKSEKSALVGRIKILSNATYLIREKARKSDRSDLVYQGKKIKYVFNEIRFNKGPPIGYVMIFDDGKVVSKIYNHEINVKMAVSKEEGRYNIVSKADFVLKSGHLQHDGVNWFGKPHALDIVGGTALIDPTERNLPKKGFHWWSPRFNGGIHISDQIIPSVGITLMGYGYSKRDLDFKFLQVGVQIDKRKDVGLNFTPVLWRPFDNTLPNTYIGPGVSIDKNGKNYFLGVSIGF